MLYLFFLPTLLSFSLHILLDFFTGILFEVSSYFLIFIHLFSWLSSHFPKSQAILWFIVLVEHIYV